MSRKQELLSRVTETAAALRAAQTDHWNALLDARDDESPATLKELGEATGIPRQTVRWRLRAARKATGRDLHTGGEGP